MDRIIDFSNCMVVPRALGGSDRKIRVKHQGEYYMLKFTEEHTKKADVSASHENKAVSEYLSSHIAQSTGLPAHDTVLGVYKDDEICVGCKDYRTQYEENIEFADFMRMIYNRSDIGKIPKLYQIYEVIGSEGFPEDLREAEVERYWDTFVVDALVGNFDRHTGNWGLLFNTVNETYSLAPAYDFGSTMFPAISDDAVRDVIHDRFEMAQRCLLFPSATLHMTAEKTGKPGYYDMLASGYNPDCTKSLLKIFPRINLNDINHIISETPFISDERKAFYRTVISARYHTVLEKAYSLCKERIYDKDALQRIVNGTSLTKEDVRHMLECGEIDVRYLAPKSCRFFL